MKCAKIIIGPLVLLAVTVIGMRAEAVNREYCLSNDTGTPEICLCKASNDWHNQENKFSTLNLLRSSCAQEPNRKCPSNYSLPNFSNKTPGELRERLVSETAKLQGAVNWTIHHVCSVEDQKAIMQLDNYATECNELTCSLHHMQQKIGNYLKERKCGCENSDCEADPDEVTTPDTVPVPSVAYPDLGEFLFQYYYHVNAVVNAIIVASDPSGSICKADC